MIDKAAALTTDSLCNCALGGVISIIDNSVSMGSIGVQDIKAEYVHNERSFVDKAKDTVFGKESAYDAKRFEKAEIKGKNEFYRIWKEMQTL